jgi:hypothetical protein
MEGNPHPRAQRRGALTFDQIRPGLEVVVIRGGRYYHRRHTITSKPYLKRHSTLDPDAIGEFIEVESWFVRARFDGAAASTEMSREGDGRSDREDEEFLSDMGLCPDYNGRWSLHYTVAADGYRPEDHE